MRPILLHPGDCLFLDGLWHIYGSLALPVRDRHGALHLLTAAHVVGGMAQGHGRTTRVCTSPIVRPAPATQLYVGEKVGCVTGLTSGVVCKVGTTVELRTKSGDVAYECVYEVMSDQDRSCFAQPGDSGAVVVDANGWVVGIVIGMQLPVHDPSSLAYVVPIDLIIQELGISLIGAR
jgi:hypothetical protein